MADLSAGEHVADRFTMQGPLGRGGMATVYLARDVQDPQPVALKVLHPHLAQDPAMRARLKREVEGAGRVEHPAALVATTLHTVGPTLALAMPFHPGRTLTQHVRERGPLPPDQVRELGARVASALAAAHRLGVLHRDVSPNNVLIDAGADDAVLADFGLARATDTATATATSMLGTPGFAPPELFDARRYGARSDLYSLGATLFFAATVYGPFGGDGPAAIMRRQLSGDSASLAELAPELPADLTATIQQLIARDPDQRPDSAAEVADALRRHRPLNAPLVAHTYPLEDAAREAAPAAPAAAKPRAAGGASDDRRRWVVVAGRRRRADPNALLDNLQQLAAARSELARREPSR